MITAEKFHSYVAVQRSGTTNMFAITLVSALTGLEKDDLMDIMKNYVTYMDEFGEGEQVLDNEDEAIDDEDYYGDDDCDEDCYGYYDSNGDFHYYEDE